MTYSRDEMSGVFLLLLLFSVVGLVWGLAAPGHLSKTARLKKPRARKEFKEFGAVFGVVAIIAVVLTAITAPKPTKTVAVKVTSDRKKSIIQAAPKPTITAQTVTTTSSIPFQTTTQNSSSVPKGQTEIAQAGQNGVETTTYLITYTNGKQTNKKQQSQTVTTPPLQQIVEDGTYVAPSQSDTATSVTANTSATTTPTSPSSACHPLSSENTCYEPGEFCSSADHGMTGVAGNGGSITCLNNDGWRWEPN